MNAGDEFSSFLGSSDSHGGTFPLGLRRTRKIGSNANIRCMLQNCQLLIVVHCRCLYLIDITRFPQSLPVLPAVELKSVTIK